MNSNTLLKIQDLYFSYDSSNILRQVNLEIQSGDALALVGPNGAGKTTLLNIIGGSLTPQQGRVCFTGVNLKDLRPKDRARLVAMVPSEPIGSKGLHRPRNGAHGKKCTPTTVAVGGSKRRGKMSLGDGAY